MNSDKVAAYIISFLLREDTSLIRNAAKCVGYTKDKRLMKQYKVVIYPSGFFDLGVYGTPFAYPPLNPPLWEGTPLLYGEPRTERLENGTLVLYADIIASTFFMISRYEEMFKREQRDAYGRFEGKESYPYKAGFIHRPIVDEYGLHLIKLLQQEGIPIDEPQTGFSKVNLTHDVDRPYAYHGIRSLARAWWYEGKPFPESYKLAFGPILKDPFWTFPRFLEWNKEVTRMLGKKCQTILFYKTPGNKNEDKPNYRMNRLPMKRIAELAKKYNAQEGYHVPLSASGNAEKLVSGCRRLEKDLRKKIKVARFHYLASGEPEDYLMLTDAGIRNDYSMGYADVAGFRLGTCRPVLYIQPNTCQVTTLMMHPLTVMDCTLDRKQYMNMNFEEALNYAKGLVEQVAKHKGELTLLFHNDLLAKEVHPYHSRLYRELLRTIVKLDPERVEEAKPRM